MNVINKSLLRAALLPRSFYRNLGVNGAHLKAILTTKLIMDDRRPNTFQQTRQKKSDKPVGSATLGTIAMSAVLGLFFLIAFNVGRDYINHLIIYFSLYIVMLSSTLISDFTSVLIDVRDNYIILPKPVNDQTVVVARLLHILIHISKLIIPMSLPGLVYMIINTTIWGAIVFLILIGLSTLLTIFLINALYIIILRLTTPAKFQTIISYFQIFIAIFIYGGYQVGIRAVSSMAMEGYDISSSRYVWLAPSYWFAGAWQGLSTFDFGSRWSIAILLSIITPFLSIWIVIRYFAPSFNQRLSQITGSSAETAPAEKNKRITTKRSGYSEALARVFTRTGAEKMGFLFCWKMTGRSKDFKMKVYPTVGYLVVLVIINMMSRKSLSFNTIQNNPNQGKIVLLSIIYFSSFVMIMAIRQIAFSEKFKAAWIYFTTPIQSPGHVIGGALKAVILKLYVPFIIVITIPALYISGPIVIANLVLGLFNQFLICALIAYLSDKFLPFSANQTVADKSGSLIRGIFGLVIPSIIGVVHYFLYDYTTVICIFAVLSVLATWLVLGSIEKTSWAAVKSSYE